MIFQFRMREYKRKVTRAIDTAQQLKNSAKDVLENKKSVNASAKEYNIKRMTS